MLWRTRPILCTDRGTALWTNSYAPYEEASDLPLLNPPAVGEKNFFPQLKITGSRLPAKRETCAR
ncbi:hypothetical protein EAO74_21555 [Streptomyces sp. gb1(2016)]|uniref:Uncharacterized protein n=1 Tax=Streptomyces sp. gb1(2016) TaxID=1828321 RepID=A0A652KPW3_9ACTN|nr:hypothetical protein EAO74_21555 [Streptomyces sp. gb1(2016)]